MDYIDQLKHIADALDRRGLLKQADLVDKQILRIAQEAQEPQQQQSEQPDQQPEEMTDMPLPDVDSLELEDDPTRETREKLSRTTFLMLSELRDFYARNLPKFKYFGEDSIETLQAAFDQLVSMYRVLLRNVGKQFDEQSLRNYELHLKNLQKEVDRSANMKLTPIKVKIDKFILYNELELLYKKIERHYDEGLKELQPVLRKARAVRDSFANIIKQTSEEVAHADLIETS